MCASAVLTRLRPQRSSRLTSPRCLTLPTRSGASLLPFCLFESRLTLPMAFNSMEVRPTHLEHAAVGWKNGWIGPPPSSPLFLCCSL